MTTQHSPLPWKTTRISRQYGCYGHNITSDHGSMADREMPLAQIGTDSDTDRANAQFIVTACNMHEELVNALQGIIGRRPESHDDWPADLEVTADALAAAHAVLKKAKEVQS